LSWLALFKVHKPKPSSHPTLLVHMEGILETGIGSRSMVVSWICYNNGGINSMDSATFKTTKSTRSWTGVGIPEGSMKKKELAEKVA
jgi:hypothetical protein